MPGGHTITFLDALTILVNPSRKVSVFIIQKECQELIINLVFLYKNSKFIFRTRKNTIYLVWPLLCKPHAIGAQTKILFHYYPLWCLCSYTIFFAWKIIRKRFYSNLGIIINISKKGISRPSVTRLTLFSPSLRFDWATEVQETPSFIYPF